LIFGSIEFCVLLVKVETPITVIISILVELKVSFLTNFFVVLAAENHELRKKKEFLDKASHLYEFSK